MFCVHSEERPFSCSQCSQKFKLRGQLKNHIRHIHSDARPFVCTICSKTFKMNLDRHQVVHTKEKLFECKKCPRKFAHSSSLKDHLKTHTGQIMKCQFCSKAFNTMPSLRAHRATHPEYSEFKKCKSNSGVDATSKQLESADKLRNCSVTLERIPENLIKEIESSRQQLISVEDTSEPKSDN